MGSICAFWSIGGPIPYPYFSLPPTSAIFCRVRKLSPGSPGLSLSLLGLSLAKLHMIEPMGSKYSVLETVSCVPRWLQHRDFLIMVLYPDQFHLLENPLCSGKGEEGRRLKTLF